MVPPNRRGKGYKLLDPEARLKRLYDSTQFLLPGGYNHAKRYRQSHYAQFSAETGRFQDQTRVPASDDSSRRLLAKSLAVEFEFLTVKLESLKELFGASAKEV